MRDVVVDERVGWWLRVWQVDTDGGEVGGVEAQFVELAEGERIVLRWFFVGSDRVRDATTETRLTVTFSPRADGTTDIELRHDRLDGMHAMMPASGSLYGTTNHVVPRRRLVHLSQNYVNALVNRGAYVCTLVSCCA